MFLKHMERKLLKSAEASIVQSPLMGIHMHHINNIPRITHMDLGHGSPRIIVDLLLEPLGSIQGGTDPLTALRSMHGGNNSCTDSHLKSLITRLTHSLDTMMIHLEHTTS